MSVERVFCKVGMYMNFAERTATTQLVPGLNTVLLVIKTTWFYSIKMTLRICHKLCDKSTFHLVCVIIKGDNKH